MPLGKVNSGDFRNGTPIILPHQFGNTATSPMPFGNVQPQSNPTLDGNPVTWAPTPTHFGNQVGYSIQCVPPVVIIAPGNTGTVDINITHLGNNTAATLSYSGAPTGVTVAFAPNPDATSSVATLTVGSSVPAGFYTITVTGSASGETETTNIHLIVAAGGVIPPPPAIVLLSSAIKTVKAGTTATTAPIDTTGASLIVAAVGSYYGTNTLVDSKSNVWTKLTEYGTGGQGDTISIFYAFAPITDVAHTFTGDDFLTQGFTSVMVAAFSGTKTTSAVFEAGTDSGHAQTNGNPVQPGSVVVAAVGDLYITAVAGYANATLAIDSGFTIIAQDVLAANSLFAGFAYLLATDLSAVNPTWTPTGSSGSGIGAAIAGFAAA